MCKLNGYLISPITVVSPSLLKGVLCWLVGKQARPTVFYVYGEVLVEELAYFVKLQQVSLDKVKVHVLCGGKLIMGNNPITLKQLSVHDGGSVGYQITTHKKSKIHVI
tara:strand:- start:6647 stop:6970 length:324 start_codon:yes stop_codon:yes gene_type:complete